MPTTPLVPLPDGLEVTSLSTFSGGLHIRITSTCPSSLCPLCSTPSFAVHSSYRRKPLDLPCAGQTIRFLLSVRKFFCQVVTCPRKIFTERLPELIKPSSRLTTRLRASIQAIRTALNGKGGARLGEHVGIHLSRMTFLRALYLLPMPPVGLVEPLSFGIGKYTSIVSQSNAIVNNAYLLSRAIASKFLDLGDKLFHTDEFLKLNLWKFTTGRTKN